MSATSKRRIKTATRNWLLFRVAGAISIFTYENFKHEDKAVQQAAVTVDIALRKLQQLMKGEQEISQ